MRARKFWIAIVFTFLSSSPYLTHGVRATPLDVFIIQDVGGSMAAELATLKAINNLVFTELKSLAPLPGEFQIGVGSFSDYAINPFGQLGLSDYPYRRNLDLTGDLIPFATSIVNLTIRVGGDAPESQLTALYQAASGAGQVVGAIPPGQQASFRAGAEKVFILITDGPFHQPGDAGDIPYPGPSFQVTAAAIQAIGAKLIGIASSAAALDDLRHIVGLAGTVASVGIDCDGNGSIDIAAGQPLVCMIGETGAGLESNIFSLTSHAIAEPAQAPEPTSLVLLGLGLGLLGLRRRRIARAPS